MSTAGEATINADGSTTFNDDTNTTTSSGGSGGSSGGDYDGIPGGDYATDEPSAADAFFMNDDDNVSKGRVDPALYLALAVLFLGVLFIYIQLRNKRKNADVDDFFANLDGDKFDLKLPPAVDEYYEVKTRCEEEGWEPGSPPPPPPPGGGQPQQPSTHHRLLAQALMKRCIADIPIVSHIQRESAGMNKLYSQSMCSVKQWKSYEAAEAMVSAEVEEVRAEADEIEPGWSNVSLVDLFVRSFFRSFFRYYYYSCAYSCVFGSLTSTYSFYLHSTAPCPYKVVWRQAMQYHNMLKQKEEQQKAQQMAAAKAIADKKREADEKAAKEKARYDDIKAKVDAEKARIANAEKMAADLLKQEEREKESKKAFSSKSGASGMKKGFLG